MPTTELLSKAVTFNIFTGLVGLEPTAYSLGGGRSIHLSYNPSELTIN